MGRSHPYLQRRGSRLFFRIGVPIALRPVVGVRELTTALRTGDRAAAVPLALQLGATAHRLFHDLKTSMNSADMKKALADARAKLLVDEVRAEMDEQVFEAHQSRIQAVNAARQDGERAALIAQINTLERALGAALSGRNVAETPTAPPQTARPPEVDYESLNVVVEQFLESYPRDRRAAMFKKHQSALKLLVALHGHKRIDTVKQADIVDYFNVVEGLPLRWGDKCKKQGVTPRELAGEDHPANLSKKTFDDNYEVPIRLFLKWARTRWQDQGFPTTLTTEGIEFGGEDDEGKNRQRAFRPDELEVLFRSTLARFRDDETTSHRWWLPCLALYTGARVNELCQVNPQTDILVSADGIEHIVLTHETQADDGVRKSIKTATARRVPLHPDLLAGGFRTYVERVQRSGARRLFPAWNPTTGRASTQAERWFRDHLAEIGLRDDTPGARVVGFHAFRHTLLAMASNSRPAVDAGPITGHADVSKSSIQRAYEGELALARKLERLMAIEFTFKP